MAILLKSGAVFLHVPRTGGSWVTEVLERCGLVRFSFASKHADMERVVRCGRHYPLRCLGKSLRHGPLWMGRLRGGFKFCFVRHPLRWYESWWTYMSGRGWRTWGPRRDRRWHPNSVLFDLGDDDFNRFVRKVIAKRPGYVTEMFGWYAARGIDFVGRQESLADDLIHVLETLDESFDETRIREHRRANASRSEEGAPEWDEGLRREVERLEHDAIVRYGYATAAEGANPRGDAQPVAPPPSR